MNNTEEFMTVLREHWDEKKADMKIRNQISGALRPILERIHNMWVQQPASVHSVGIHAVASRFRLISERFAV